MSDTEPSNVAAFVGAAGGAGTTRTVIEVGSALAAAGSEVAVLDAAFERGLLTLGCGHRTIRLLPPLDSTEREIELGAELFADAIAGAT